MQIVGGWYPLRKMHKLLQWILLYWSASVGGYFDTIWLLCHHNTHPFLFLAKWTNLCSWPVYLVAPIMWNPLCKKLILYLLMAWINHSRSIAIATSVVDLALWSGAGSTGLTYRSNCQIKFLPSHPKLNYIRTWREVKEWNSIDYFTKTSKSTVVLLSWGSGRFKMATCT